MKLVKIVGDRSKYSKSSPHYYPPSGCGTRKSYICETLIPVGERSNIPFVCSASQKHKETLVQHSATPFEGKRGIGGIERRPKFLNSLDGVFFPFRGIIKGALLHYAKASPRSTPPVFPQFPKLFPERGVLRNPKGTSFVVASSPFGDFFPLTEPHTYGDLTSVSKKCTSFQNPIYLYWYAFPLWSIGSFSAPIRPVTNLLDRIFDLQVTGAVEQAHKALKNLTISYSLPFSLDPLPYFLRGNLSGEIGDHIRTSFAQKKQEEIPSSPSSSNSPNSPSSPMFPSFPKGGASLRAAPLASLLAAPLATLTASPTAALMHKCKKSIKKASMPFLRESDQVTFTINAISRHSALLQSSPLLGTKSTQVTVWQSSLNKEYHIGNTRNLLFNTSYSDNPLLNNIVETDLRKTCSLTKEGAVFLKSKDHMVNKQFQLFPGQLVAYGEKIAHNVATTESGQILYVDSQRTTLRKAQTVLIYSQAILAVLSGEWIKKGTPLMALSYQKLVTGDIVQGLPKIEQFFEAPLLKDGTFWGDSLQAKLNLFFQEHREKLPLAEAVRKGFSDIQRVLVEGVQRVYISQGVLIADKHLEVIVRQMTCKGRILYSGDTGFLRNELVSLDKIESVNQVTYGQKALYHPQVRGITDASLESESFLSAASFQETTRVLSRDAVIGKTDLMRGLKERVIVGELIQAGTGLANNSVYNLLF